MIRQLKEELREYDDLKSDELTLPNVERLDQIAPFVAKMRIAKRVSQTELARRLGVNKQVISRYEETEYQTVAISRLQEILDAIGIKALVSLSAWEVHHADQRTFLIIILDPQTSAWSGGTASRTSQAVEMKGGPQQKRAAFPLQNGVSSSPVSSAAAVSPSCSVFSARSSVRIEMAWISAVRILRSEAMG
jgi:transcriptional regulator with XRE-family HTH domain